MARRRSSASFNLGGGVRVRIGTKSSSVSVGGKRGRVTVNSKGTRTTTVRAGGMSVTSQRKKAKPKTGPAATAPVTVSPTMPLRRKTADGYVSFDGRRLTIQRATEGRFEVEPSQVTSIEIDGKNLVITVAGQGAWEFKLRTWLTFKDLQFVNEVAWAAGIRAR